jgi:hypothetical protein
VLRHYAAAARRRETLRYGTVERMGRVYEDIEWNLLPSIPAGALLEKVVQWIGGVAFEVLGL